MGISLPNALLFVQMFHFFVAFIIIKYILFKPGLAVIQQENLFDQQLEHKSTFVHEEVAHHESDVRDQWKRCRSHLQSKRPEIKHASTPISAHRYEQVPEHADIRENEVVDAVCATFVKQVTKHERR